MPSGASSRCRLSPKPPLRPSCHRTLDERREAAIAKRLDQVDRRIARLERDTGISVETLALFVRFRLTTTPPLPEPAAKAARAQGERAWDSFVTALGRRLSQGPNLRQEIPEDTQESEST
ncbi:putative DsbA family dithiol-disulfide isomerase [Bradyrhizobium sp. GM0.4]